MEAEVAAMTSQSRVPDMSVRAELCSSSVQLFGLSTRTATCLVLSFPLQPYVLAPEARRTFPGEQLSYHGRNCKLEPITLNTQAALMPPFTARPVGYHTLLAQFTVAEASHSVIRYTRKLARRTRLTHEPTRPRLLQTRDNSLPRMRPTMSQVWRHKSFRPLRSLHMSSASCEVEASSTRRLWRI